MAAGLISPRTSIDIWNLHVLKPRDCPAASAALSAARVGQHHYSLGGLPAPFIAALASFFSRFLSFFTLAFFAFFFFMRSSWRFLAALPILAANFTCSRFAVADSAFFVAARSSFLD